MSRRVDGTKPGHLPQTGDRKLNVIKERPKLLQYCVMGMLFVAVSGYGTIAQGQIQDFAVIDTTPLMRFGPTNPVNGYPMWVQDSTGLVLELCEDTNDVTPPLGAVDELGNPLGPCPACVDAALDLPDPTLPQSFPDNYPDEHFFWLSESIMVESDNTRSIVVMAIEGAFDGLGAVVDGEQVVFARYRVRVDNATPGELYQITYPFGVTYAEAENDQGGAAISNINFTNDIFLWKGAPLIDPISNIMGTFLTSVDPPPPAGSGDPPNTETYLADFCGAGLIQGSPFDTNFFSVVGPNAGMVLSTGNTVASFTQCDPTDPAMVAAFDAYDAYRIANVDPLAGPLARIPSNCTFSDEFGGIAKPATRLGVQVDRATYNRDLTAGTNSTQINVWATSFEGQNIQLEIPGVVDPITMCGDGTGNYFAHSLFPSSFIPPSTVIVTNLTDDPPTSVTHTLSANLQILSAVVSLDPIDPTLVITSSIADPDQGGTSLSTGGAALTSDPLDPTIGTAEITLAVEACGVVPPLSVTIDSAQGGTVTAPTTILGVVPDVLAAAGGTVVVAKGSLATLDGSASIGLGLSYSWVQTGGTAIALAGGTTASPSFTFPSVDDLITLVLTVTDQNGMTSSDTAIVTNTVVAVAGTDQDLLLFPDAGVALDASASQGSGLSYVWSQIATDTIASPQCAGETLDRAASIAVDALDPALATLTMPLEGGCVTLELTVAGPGGTATDSITIKAPVGAPLADAGADIVVFTNELVQLDASASSGIINTDGTGFAWTQTAGETVELGTLQSDGSLLIDPAGPPGISMPAFIFPSTFQTLTFQVVVSGPGGSTSDIVNVIVDDPGTADTLTPGRARYDGKKARFTISGTSSIPGPGHSVTCWLGDQALGLEIGTAAVDAIADWKIDVIGGINPCEEDPGLSADCDTGTPTMQLRCISTLGGALLMDYEARR